MSGRCFVSEEGNLRPRGQKEKLVRDVTSKLELKLLLNMALMRLLLQASVTCNGSPRHFGISCV